MILKKQLHWFIYPLFVLACARQTSPTGGPKDTIPPTLTKSLPPNGQIKYKLQQVELTFSELIQLNNPKEQIIITPDVGKDYNAVARKNKLIMTFENPLKDSTTYSINFRETVQDITEKNPATNLKLAFSTGDYIDSLIISGKVSQLIQNSDGQDITVALYQADTFNIFKHKPVYLTRTNKTGIYQIENLKPGKYFLYAIDDKNKNLIVDSKTESFGFLRDTLTLTKNVKNINIPLIRLDTRDLKLTSARPYNTYFNLKTSKNLNHFKLSTQEEEILISSFGEDAANVRIYNTIENDKDSVLIRFQATDSLRNAIDTTLYIKFNDRKTTPEKFDFKRENFRVVENKGEISGKVKFTKPLLNINYDSIFYRIDSINSVSFTAQDVAWDSLTNTLTLAKTFNKALLLPTKTTTQASERNPLPSARPPVQNDREEPQPPALPVNTDRNQQQAEPPTKADQTKSAGKKKTKPTAYELYFGKNAFTSIELDSSKQSSETIKPIKLEESGIILVSIQTDQPHFIVQLTDKSFKVVHSFKDTKKVNFEDLSPGEYQVRLIIDKNNDGEWSPGNFFNKEEPEPITYYKNEKGLQTINLKANWEIGPLLIKF